MTFLFDLPRNQSNEDIFERPSIPLLLCQLKGTLEGRWPCHYFLVITSNKLARFLTAISKQVLQCFIPRRIHVQIRVSSLPVSFSAIDVMHQATRKTSSPTPCAIPSYIERETYLLLT